MKCDFPYIIKLEKPIYNIVDGLFIDSVPVNCGKCLNCKKNKVNQWAFRLEKEKQRSYSAYFVTLTYDTQWVPITPKGFMTLVKTTEGLKNLKSSIQESTGEKVPDTDVSLQAFFKRLRYYEDQIRVKGTISKDQFKRKKQTTQAYFTDKKLRFYAAGEYGERRKRPHYHILLFNLMSTDSIRSAWTFGGVHVGEVNEATINYCLKYIDKDQKSYLFKAFDGIKEFSVMSKKLGSNYIDNESRDYHRRPYNNFTTNSKGIKIPLSKYYRDKILTKQDKNRAIIYIADECEKIRLETERLLKKDGKRPEVIEVSQKFNRQNILKNKLKSRDID